MRIRSDIYAFPPRRTFVGGAGPIHLVCPDCGGRARVRIGLRNALRRAIDSGGSSRASGCGFCPRCHCEFGVSVQVDADHMLPGAIPQIEWDDEDLG